MQKHTLHSSKKFLRDRIYFHIIHEDDQRWPSSFFSEKFLYLFPDITIKAMEITRIFDLLTNLEEKFPDKQDILAKKKHGQWIKYSVKDYAGFSYKVAYSLLKEGFKPGDKIATICINTPEWNFVDMGTALAGMVHVPVYPTLGKDEYQYILTHSDAKAVFIGNMQLYKKIEPIIRESGLNIRIILFEDNEQGIESFNDFVKLSENVDNETIQQIERNKREISPDSLATIIYTSGTTGTPKGVMLSHRNLTFDAHAHAVKQCKTHEHKMLSVLPICHAYERSMNYEYQELGISIYYAENVGTFAADLASCHADGFCGVPRMLEMMYGKLESAGKSFSGIKKKIYSKAWDFGNSFDNYNHSPFYLLKRSIYDRLVYSKWREKLGGHEMLVVSGGSSIQPKIIRLFNAAKLHIFEGYGMTEASPVIAVNSPRQGFNVIGTVGKPIEGTELKFAEDGEILTRGPHVMLGYYKDQEATKAVIDEDGWLHTGDIGCLVDDTYLKITDRKKEIFKLSSGKYVAPQVIENKLKESPYIDNCIVVGENEKFASAIIIPDKEKITETARLQGIAFDNADDLLKDKRILSILHGEVHNVNGGFSPHEHIKREKYILDEWSPANKMLSQTLKLKRANIHKRYADLIKSIYSEQGGGA